MIINDKQFQLLGYSLAWQKCSDKNAGCEKKKKNAKKDGGQDQQQVAILPFYTVTHAYRYLRTIQLITLFRQGSGDYVPLHFEWMLET